MAYQCNSDIQLILSDGNRIVESFAGLGENREAATKSALENFCRSSLHVFLAAFWNRTDEDQVSIEQWPINGARWRVVIGNYLTRSFDGSAVQVPEGFFKTLERMIKELALPGSTAWVRAF